MGESLKRAYSNLNKEQTLTRLQLRNQTMRRALGDPFILRTGFVFACDEECFRGILDGCSGQTYVL